MATPFSLTANQAVTVGPTTTLPFKQNLWDVLDVGNFDILDVEVGILALSGSSPTATIQIETSAQNSQDDASWIPLTGLTWTPTATGYSVKPQVGGFLRYIRYNLTTLTGGGSVTFVIRGMGRRYGA